MIQLQLIQLNMRENTKQLSIISVRINQDWYYCTSLQKAELAEIIDINNLQ